MRITSTPHSLCIDIIILGLELFEANLRLLPVHLEVHLRLLDVVREHLDQSEVSIWSRDLMSTNHSSPC